jgi:hypothetical protein
VVGRPRQSSKDCCTCMFLHLQSMKPAVSREVFYHKPTIQPTPRPTTCRPPLPVAATSGPYSGPGSGANATVDIDPASSRCGVAPCTYSWSLTVSDTPLPIGD